MNARLTAVKDAAGLEGWDGAPSGGTSLWTGDVGVFYEERRDRSRSTEDVQMERTLTVTRDGVPIAWEVGNVLTFTRELTGTPDTGTVRAIDAADPEPGQGGEVVLTLELAG